MKKFLITTLLTLSFAAAAAAPAKNTPNADYSISTCSYFDVVVL